MIEDVHSESEQTAPEGSVDEAPSDPLRAVTADPLVGTVLDNRFEIEEVLGSGGAGVVYKAKQLRVNRHVAIKTIRMQVDNEVIRERFQREITSLCALNHPNIVTVYDCLFGWDGQPYVVMDYLKGLALDQLLKRDGAMDLNKFARIALQIVSALDHAHKKDIVHRDLKPGNIVLIDDDTDIVKVVDFGLAKLTHDRSLTKTGELWGSPPYMSPEQAQGEPADSRSDIYSLGAVMYEMLSGKDPFYEVATVYELIQAHVLTPPPRFSESNRNVSVPLAVEDTIRKCLEKRPEDRFQTVGELQSTLVDALAGQLDGDSRDYLLRMRNNTDQHRATMTRQAAMQPKTTMTRLTSMQPRTTMTRHPALQVTRRDEVIAPASPPTRIQQNTRYTRYPGSAERWLPWTIAACCMVLAISSLVVAYHLLNQTRTVPAPVNPTAQEDLSAPKNTPKIEVTTAKDDATETRVSPHLVHKSAPVDLNDRSLPANTDSKKARNQPRRAHPQPTARPTKPKSNAAKAANPKSVIKDPWGALLKER